MAREDFFNKNGIYDKGNRVLLRKFEDQDHDDYLIMRNAYFEMPEEFKKYDFDYPQYLWEFATDEENSVLCLAIVDLGSNRLIGYATIDDYDSKEPAIGLEIISSFRGKGYGTETVELMLRHAKEVNSTNTFIVKIYDDNYVSKALFRRYHITEIGTELPFYVENANLNYMDAEGNIDFTKLDKAYYEGESKRRIVKYKLAY